MILADYLAKEAKGDTYVMVSSCSDHDAKQTEQIVMDHNKKSGVTKVKPCWGTAGDMYAGGSPRSPPASSTQRTAWRWPLNARTRCAALRRVQLSPIALP